MPINKRDLVIPSLLNNTPPHMFQNTEESPNKDATRAELKMNSSLCSNVCKYSINCNTISPMYKPTK